MKNLKNALLLKQLYWLKNLGYAYTSLKPYHAVEAKLTLPDTLETLKSQALSCHLCELSKSRQKVVFGEGNPSAFLMIVGNSPSISDDSSGKIFSGRAGDMLDKMLENVLGLSREEIYISNVLKCRGLDNQNPTPSHAHTCQFYLRKEIELIQPKIIIALGQSAYHALSGNESAFTEIRGRVSTQDNYKLIATYHPSFLLRNPSLKKEVFEDLKKVKKLLENDGYP